MGVDLLKHNQEAFQEINKMLESGKKKIAAPRATGSGKTYLMGALAEKYHDAPKLVLEPTRPLLNSIKEKFDEFGITNTDFITYQKLIRMSDEDIAAMDYKLIFLDECHHGTAPIWGLKINHLMETHSDSIIFGTSATTVRNDGVDVVESLFEGNVIGELPLSTAIARSVLPCPHYISTIYRLDDELDKLKKKIENATNTKSEKREFYKKMQTMKHHFEKSYGVPLILNKYIKVKNGRYLVFCKDKKHLNAMRDVVINWFYTAGIKDVHSYAVYSDYPDKEKDYQDFCEDNSESAKILFSINILNEGLHIKDISGVLMLRTTQSNLIYLQQLGRLVEAENLDKYLVVFDFVNNFSSVNDGIGLLKEIKDAIAKEKESDPDYDDSGFVDIDTFFVLEQVVEIQEMFKEIEGRLKGIEWTEEENNILKKYYPTEGLKVKKRLKSRTDQAIMAQAIRLGIKAIYRLWTDNEIWILKEYYPSEGIKVKDRLSGKTQNAIRSKVAELNLKASNNLWTDNEIELLRKYYPIYGKDTIKYIPKRSIGVIQGKAQELGIKKQQSIFAESEDELIRKYYPTEGGEIYKRLHNKTKTQCTQRAAYLGISFNKNLWTDDEIETIKEFYPQIGTQVSTMINRSKDSCMSMARKLGIKYKRKNKYKYVHNCKNKFVVEFAVDGKIMRFGRFDSIEEAVKVAMQKAKEFGKAI